MKTNQPTQSEVRKSSLKWRWAKGQDTMLDDFGDPVQADGYALCVFDLNGPSALLNAAVPFGTSWRPRRNGFAYREKSGAPQGVTAVELRAGGDGKARIVVRAAKGPDLMLPTLPLTSSPLRLAVQLQGHGECWGAGYIASGVRKNTSTEFVARSSPSGAFLVDGP